jgi:DNA primase
VLIPDNKIEEILARVDLVALVSRHVELKKAGRSWKGRCPFHQEKSASFHVTPEMGRFKCFGCQAGGDAIAFVQRYLGKTFVDAVRDLAREVGVDLEAAEDPTARERQQLKEVTDFAAEHFKSRLWDAEAGKAAREYLQGRGVTDEVARAFGLGLAPAAWSELADKLNTAGLLEFGALAGLVAKRQKGDGYYDMFRGRLVIPIRAPEGRTIAFGGRLLESAASAAGTDGGPKYLNSRESKLYNKSETLYGMDQARDEIRRAKSAVLVEGYFDCIGMHQAGVKNAVALCSTALTAGHLGLLARSEAKELILLLDGDDAGRKAVERLAGPILAAGASAKVALLPEGEDPDTFARRVGPEGVRALLGSSRTLTQHLFATVLPGGPEATFEAKMQAIDRLKPIAAVLPVGLARSAFFAALASHSGLPAAELEASLRGKVQPVQAVPKPNVIAAPPPKPVAQASDRAPDALEAYLAALALKDRKLLAKDAHRVCDQLTHAGLRNMLARLASGQSPEEALYEATPIVKGALLAAAQKLPAEPSEWERVFVSTCQRLMLRRIEEQLSYIARVTASLEGASELNEEMRRLLTERSELLALKRKVLEEPQGK